LRELAENVVEALQDNSLADSFPTVNAYIVEHDHFKVAVQKITLSEYYKLTKIELTCTSVDLDNQVLRFFNHKTTPNLPVCRSVQMTGSFPVGFKAQQWQPSWGKYLVHYADVRREVNITGHEFTDGGMLANFPIKYFDNDYIRDNYFSHVINKSKNKYETILLGFGLDKLDPANYHQNEIEIYEGRLQKS
jgi:predicted acylesterase/phospholipase RssA